MGRPWAIGSLAVVLVVGIAVATYLFRAPDTPVPAVTEAVSEPAATEADSKPAATEAASEPAATETVSEPAATETVSEPAATEAASEPAATETVSEPDAAREPSSQAGADTAASPSEEQPAPDPSAPTELQPVGPVDKEESQTAETSASEEPGSTAEPEATDGAGDQAVAALPETVTEPDTQAAAPREQPAATNKRDESAEDRPAERSDPPSPSFPPPSFDIVRIERSGEAVIAGRSAPGSEVQIILNGEVLGRVTSDARGQWVFLPPSPLASGSHELSLRSELADGALTESDNIVVVVVPELRVAGSDQSDQDESGEPEQTAESTPSQAVDPAAEDQTAKASETASQTAESPGTGSDTDAAERSEEARAEASAEQEKVAAGPEVTEIATIPDPDAPADEDSESAVEPSAQEDRPATSETGSSKAVAKADQEPLQTNEDSVSSEAPAKDQTKPAQQRQSASAHEEPDPSGQDEAAPAVQSPQVAAAQDDPDPQEEADSASQGPLAILLPREGQGGAKILQDPAQTGVGDLQLVLRSVDYDADGNVTISGEATAGAKVIVYLDNEPIGQGVVGKAGLWRFTPRRPVAAGLHRLRVDQLDDEGGVVARVETPFSRAAILTNLPQEQFVVVQPGNSLWRIARSVYGEGPRYSVIYQSNKRQIREPDLIYPGQIFLVPQVN